MPFDSSTHESYWRARHPAPVFPALDRDLETDVLVVGAGITGLTTALLLAEAGVAVAVVEAWDVGAGVTGRSTGHLTQLVDGRYAHIQDAFGSDGARLVCQATRGAIEEVGRLAERYAPEARYRRVPAYLVAETEDQRAEVERELEAAREAGVPVEAVTEMPLPYPVPFAIRATDQAEFDPYGYAVGLAEALRSVGVPLFTQTRIQEVEPGGIVVARTEAGREIHARQLVYATHVPLGRSVLQTVQVPYRSYVIGLRLPAGDPYPDALAFDAADPYHYVRSAGEGDGRVLVVGGADHKTGEGGEDDAPYRRLAEYAQTRWPGAEVAYRWSAEVFEPNDGLPTIGESPFAENVLVATGFSGDGLIWGTVSGRVLSDLARGVANPYADLLSPKRLKPLARAAEFLEHNTDVGIRFVADRFSADVDGPGDLKPGQGGLARVGAEHLALYRDEGGRVHALSPVCPHLHCVVHWNGADRTWGCPCHGSRFAATGEVISGPSMHGLDRKELPAEE